MTKCQQLKLKDFRINRYFTVFPVFRSKIAGDARKAIEDGIKKSVITNKTAVQLNHTVVQMIEASAEVVEENRTI